LSTFCIQEMPPKFDLQINHEGSDSFIEVLPQGDDCLLTKEDFRFILEKAAEVSMKTRRKIKYIVIRGVSIKTDESDSGRHLRIQIPNRRKPLASLPDGEKKALNFKSGDIPNIQDEEGRILYPQAEDLRNGLVIPYQKIS
jgi:hypothetical protein